VIALKQNSLWLYAQALTKRASQSYVAGAELNNAIRACHRFAQAGLSSTVAYWNRDDDGAQLVANNYLNALNALATEKLASYLSIKATALKLSAGLVAAVAEQSQQHGLGLHFDAMEPESAEPTWALLATARQHSDQVGCTLPGRWRRSLVDVARANELGLRVRVVKGQWADPAYRLNDLRAGYLAVIDRLAGRPQPVAVATHDPELAREALRRLQAAGTPCELELLYGLPMKAVRRVADETGSAVRVYVPYGEAWLPYRLSQVRKNPRVMWWVLRDALLAR
jgi:proline dehydrogenase